MTINQALDKFQANGCETAFAVIYEHIYEGGRKIIPLFAKRYRLDELDVESMINEKLLDIAIKFDSSRGKFKNAVYAAIKLGCIDLLRKQSRKASHEMDVMYENENGDLIEVYEEIAVAPTTDEDDIIAEIQKKHDQRQLTAFLLSKADELTLTSASAFIATDSFRQAAKQTQTTHVTISRRIRKLAKFHDSEKFGSYYDYLTVPTTFVG